MTTIINKYIGITHPMNAMGVEDAETYLEAWKTSNCPNGIHLWDEVWSVTDHYLVCDACDLEVHIEKVIVPDGKDVIIDNSNARMVQKK